MYSSSFGVTLLALTMITTLVILAVTSNVMLSLRMMGALSIVRFRTAIKEPLDIVFLFWSIAVGIVLAAGMIPLAVIGSVLIGIVLLVFVNKKSYRNPYIVVVNCCGADSERQVQQLLSQRTARCTVKSKAVRGSGVELNLEVRLEDGGTDFVNALSELEGVSSASWSATTATTWGKQAMSSSRRIDAICLLGVLSAILLTGLFLNAETLGLEVSSVGMGYENRLFDPSAVHTIDIVMDDWEGFLETCQDKEYASCTVVVDGQACKNVGIRAKGNNFLTSVASYGNNRYSFKVEFDHYDSAKTYFGLDKLSLTSLIQGNTMMKDCLVYRLMADFGVDAPLCSYVYLTVNGEDWGLYLAVEGVEESFLQRNYGGDYGELYKPDSMNQGSGGPMGAGSGDVKLQYTDDNPDSYPNIFNNAKTDPSQADRQRLISSLRALSEGTDLESVLNTDEILRYFVVHNFVCNFDSYTGQVIHNYYLYEEDGVLSMIPWDYNLAFGSFQSNAGADEIVNFSIDTPVVGGDMDSRPMVAWIFNDPAYTEQYHQYFRQFLAQFFESGTFEALLEETFQLIAPYVEQDPTRFCTYEEFEQGAAALKEFCLLRARSISGQLDGSIPATSDGQRADGSALIDASTVDLSDTGSMSGGAPGGALPGPGLQDGVWEGGPFPPAEQAFQPDSAAGDPQATPENEAPDGGNGIGAPLSSGGQSSGRPEGGPGGDPGQWSPPGGGASGDQAAGPSPVPALALSAAVLAFGLLFALLFRRR